MFRSKLDQNTLLSYYWVYGMPILLTPFIPAKFKFSLGILTLRSRIVNKWFSENQVLNLNTFVCSYLERDRGLKK